MVTDNMKDLEIAMEVEMEYQLEDVEMGTYEEWLEGELLEMGIDWEQDDLVHKEENMMVVGSQQYPPHHSEGSYPPQSPPTIAEKGVEGGNVGGMSFTEDDGQVDIPQDIPLPPPTPGLSFQLGSLEIEESECLCSISCTGVHTHRAGQEEEIQRDECVCSVSCEGIQTHRAGQEEDKQRDECVCSVSCEGIQTHIQTGSAVKDYELGIKYCPGNEPVLPTYSHVSYKPSTSTRNFTIYTHITKNTMGEEVEEEEAMETVREDREEGIDSEEVDFQKTEVGNLIADWEARAGGGDLLKPPELEDRGRRRSEEFTILRLKFMEHDGGVREDKKTARPDDNLPTFSNINTVTLQGRGAVRKLFSHSMVGRRETLLARPSANSSKRKWDQGGLAKKRHCGN